MLGFQLKKLPKTYRVHLRYDVLSCDTNTQSLVRSQVPPIPAPNKAHKAFTSCQGLPQKSKCFAILTPAIHDTQTTGTQMVIPSQPPQPTDASATVIETEIQLRTDPYTAWLGKIDFCRSSIPQHNIQQSPRTVLKVENDSCK